jgi:hypothetical protein
MSITRANGPDAYTGVTLTARPSRIAGGGIVLLTAEPPDAAADHEFTVRWLVRGPVRLSEQDTRIALLGVTTVAGRRVTLQRGDQLLATLDTSPLTPGSWEVEVVLTRAGDEDQDDGLARGHGSSDQDDDGDGDSDRYDGDGDTDRDRYEDREFRGVSGPIEVLPRPFAAGDDVAVTLKRSAVPATSDQALWVSIRQSTNALGFENYSRFLDVVMCGEPVTRNDAGLFSRDTRHQLRKVKRRTALPFPNVDRYRLLKAATEVFLMTHCGVDLGDFRHVDLDEESRRLNRQVRPGDLEAQLRDYLDQVPTGTGESLDVLPYLGLIRLKLRDIPIVGRDDDDESAEICYGILAEKLANPCFLELLWSYWADEAGLMQTMNAISWRFQNRTSGGPGRDPLAGLDIDPLRPLNNLFWGWIQDTPHRLSLLRRAYEYDHLYGLALAHRPGPPVRGADSRSRFIEAFHHLLAVCSEFFIRDDDTTVIADGFGVLNTLKETHLLLTEGAHNQYGDLPWTARHQMLIDQWIIARPEMRDFLPTRTMVAHPEGWMPPVEAMNKLQGWTDVSVLHFRDLAVFGEQLLLSIRFGAWTTVNEPEQAANWARYWRSELQCYAHAYRAVTGVDLTQRADPSIPAFHLRRRRLGRRRADGQRR